VGTAIGQAAALSPDRPFTYGGYHFAVLESDEINALSCPGGLIFITRGMVQKAKNAEELAAILAHEVAHVNHEDGLASIQKSRWVEAVSILGSEAARKFGGAELTKLVSLFEGSANDVMKTLLVNGYGREQEASADRSTLTFFHRLGYNPYGLPDLLGTLAQQQTSGTRQGIFATPPGMKQRIPQCSSTLSKNQWPRTGEPRRDQRFRGGLLFQPFLVNPIGHEISDHSGQKKSSRFLCKSSIIGVENEIIQKLFLR